MINPDELKKEILPCFQTFGPHDFSHTSRVYDVAVKIAGFESADKETVMIAALLHDIARLKESADKHICHADMGAEMSRSLLAGRTDMVEAIAYAIKVHRFSKGIVPETIEAKILQDADRLDSLGAVVIARTFSQDGIYGNPIYDPSIPPNKKYTGRSATGLNHLYEKILEIRPKTFHTATARMMAENRYNFVRLYVNQFKMEWVGER